MTNPSSSSPLQRKIIRNTLFNFVGRFWAMLVGLLLTPYIVSMLGVERYGLWSLIFVITRYLGLLDLGTGTAFVKYVAEYYTRRDYDAINEIVNTGFAFYLALAFILIALAVLFDDFILRVFGIPPEIFDEAKVVFLGGVVILSFSNVFGIFQGVMKGLQRMDVMNAIALAMSLPDVTGTIAFLQLGYGLRGLIIKEAIIFVLAASLFVFYAFRLLPSLKVGFRFCRRQSLRELLGYGVKVQVSQLADLVNSQIDKVLLGYFVGLSSVAFYEVGSKVVLTSKRLPRILISAIMPAASEIDVSGNTDLLQQLFTRTSKYLAFAASPLFLFVVSTAPLIMALWMGPGYHRSAIVIQLLAMGHLVHLFTGPGTMIVKGIGEPGYETRYTLVLLLLNTVLGVILVIWLGFWGVLIATPFSLFVSSVYFMRVFHELLGIPLARFVRIVYFKPLVTCALMGLAIYCFNYEVQGLPFFQQSGLTRLILFGLEGVVFIGSYLVLMLRTGYLDAYDRQLLLRTGRVIVEAWR